MAASRKPSTRPTAPWRVRLFPLLDRLVTRALKTASVLHRGFWLGVLDRQALHRLTERQYRAWPKYRTAEYNNSGLRDWEEAMIDRWFAGCESLLVAAAGGGREMLALERRGFRVDGFDCSADLVASCRSLLAEHAPNARVLLAGSSQVPEGLTQYDGAVLGWGAYTHVVGRRSRVDLLRRLRQHLRRASPLLVSFFVRDEPSREFEWTRRIAHPLRRLRRDDLVELGDTLDRTFDHWFTRGELEMEMVAAGFELLDYGADRPPHAHAVARSLPNAL